MKFHPINYLQGILSKPTFQDIEEDEGTGLDPEMERRLNAAKEYMLSDDYAAHRLNKSEAQVAALGMEVMHMKSPEKSRENEMERARDLVSKRRMEIGKNRKELYLRAFVRKERSFEQILARKKVVQKEEAKIEVPAYRELLELVGGNPDIMKPSDGEALSIRTMLAERGVKAKKKLHERAVKAGHAKPRKEDSFWSKEIAPLWRESYMADSSDEDDDEDEEKELNKMLKKK